MLEHSHHAKGCQSSKMGSSHFYPASSVIVADLSHLDKVSIDLKSISLLSHLILTTTLKNYKWLNLLSMIT